MPTGVHLRDARAQLFDAAERLLLRDGPNAVTSRAVTDEAGCAKGVLHRHFDDFDDFLTQLVLDRVAQLEAQARELRATAGSATVADNLSSALTNLFGPVPLAIIPLITFRDELRVRLRHARPGGGIAVLAEATAAIAAYLTAERDLGRIAPDTDIDSLTLSLVGGGHLLLADRDAAASESRSSLHKLVTTAIAAAIAPPTFESRAAHGWTAQPPQPVDPRW